MENDTIAGGEELPIDQAAAAYAKATTSEVDDDQADIEDNDEGVDTDDELQASDEEAGEEADGETESEDQAEDGEGEDDDEPESEQGRFVGDNAKVRLADGSVVTIAELKSGSLRNADYTRKTQELAEQRRSFESQSSTFQAEQKQLSEQREYVSKLLQSITPQPPDPSMLQTDPMGYMQQKDQYERFQQHLAYLQQTSAEEKQKAEQQAQTDRQRKARQEWGELLGKAPELQDKAKLAAFEADMIKYGQEAYGFSPQELFAQVPMDHRFALVLRDAIYGRKLRDSKPKVAKKLEGRPPVTKGGKRLSPQGQQARRASDAFTRLKKTGSVEDAAAAYLASKG